MILITDTKLSYYKLIFLWQITIDCIDGSKMTKIFFSQANELFEDIGKLKKFVDGLYRVIDKLRNDDDFQERFKTLIELAKSPFAQSFLGGSVDVGTIELIFHSLVNDNVSYFLTESIYRRTCPCTYYFIRLD